MTRAAGPGPAADDVVPLAPRVAAMSGFRLLFVAVLLTLAALHPAGSWRAAAGASVAYLAITAVLSLTVLLPSKGLAVRCFGVSLLVDGIFIEYQRQALYYDLPTDAVLVTFVVAVCLLASFRTGLKIAVWQSVLMLVALRGRETGLFPAGGLAPGELDGDSALLADLVMLWGVVLTTAVAAATNERELRRRRYDAEVMARFAERLHLDTRPDEVAAHVAEYAVGEQGARAALVVRELRGRLSLVAGRTADGAVPAPDPAAAAAGSALLALPRRVDGATLARRLDPARDPWLAALLPDARRLVVVDLVEDQTERTSVVVALGRRGDRAERRVVAALLQAVVTAALAWSRAELLEASERRAATDGLTGLANRRTFDGLLARLLAQWRSAGTPFALVLVDVDHFKSVNDRLGHQAGDEVLQAVARILAEHAEQGGATAARYGGEEFALLLPGVGVGPAAALAEVVRVALHDLVDPVRVTASFGAAAVPEHAGDTDTLVHVADAALIAAKHAGRDRVVVGGDHRMPADAAAAPVPPPPVPPSVPPPPPPPPPVPPSVPPSVPAPRRRDLRAAAPDA